MSGLNRCLACAAGMLPLLFAGQTLFADVNPHGGMIRYPDVSDSNIVFVYANDLWIVPREGGAARPLASPPGAETNPKFSPNGQTIAFAGNYEGDRDIYTIPIEGGVSTRVTHHPDGERITDYSSTGIVFNSSGLAGLARQDQIFTVGPEGGLPEELPVPYGAAGAVSDDGQWLAYTPFNRDARTWKRYRGGLASDIWLFNLENGASRKITEWEGTDTIPMWHGETVYYLSDAGPEARLNIWAYNSRTQERRQVTSFNDYDVKWPSIGPGPNGEGEIVFQLADALHLLNLRTASTTEVSMTIPGDRPTIRTQTIDASEFMQSAGISSTGKRAVVGARGDVWTLPAEEGIPRNLTRTDGVYERNPAWSPDGRWIAYFSDASGDYELYITQSDGQGETKQLTEESSTFYTSIVWAPDSEKIAFTDKAGNIHLHSTATGETKIIDTDPFAFDFSSNSLNWSHDSRWLTYALAGEQFTTRVIVYNTETDQRHEVTAGMFTDSQPAFDRKGDYLYFTSARSFAPTYSDVDTTFVYDDSQVLLAVPLRDDIESPWLPESDEEEWEEETGAEEAEEGEAKGDDETEDDDEDVADDEGDAQEEPEEEQEPAPDDGISGTWNCTVDAEGLPPGLEVTLYLTLSDDNSITGSVSTTMGGGTVSGTFTPTGEGEGELNLTIVTDAGDTATVTAKVSDNSMTGEVSADMFAGTITGTRDVSATDEDADDAADDKPAETVEIDLDGFEGRAILLPVPPGSFNQLAVNDKNQLLYARTSQRSDGGGAAIQVFDIDSDDKAEKNVVAGAAGFDISGDGKKLLIRRGNGFAILNASAGASPKNVPTDNMRVRIDPRKEWKQIFNDAWRLMRIYFYDPNMHGVDWAAIREQYEPMIDDAVNREEVSFVISEMISELNVGHAYYFGGDVEDQPSESVGMLGVDFELDNGAYRIAKIHQGAPWDVDARGPLSQPGVDVNEGDYLLAVNDEPLDTSRDPWAAFVGLAGATVKLTVSEDPELNDNDREVLVEPIASEVDLRYRDWIEANRSYVEEQTGGKVGYVYVPDTGVNGQTNLVRQLQGQLRTPALIIDERWNGGGQIPTRFIEILNRPVTNYWARRDQNDWPWPPDAHQGPKCMLINGPAGSGGDAFPYYFRQAGLGKLIGSRTWGGLVGISGTPGLIDGAVVTAPTFAFYEVDGTWGVEGHGVDPDIPVVADPAKMQDGGDPQLDAAIAHMLEELERNPYVAPSRPPSPDRSGMGLPEEDK